MNLVSDAQFDVDGGLTIGVGAKNCLYTLRTEHWDTVALKSEHGVVDTRRVRRSYHLRNLGKDWAEVAQRLPSILMEAGYAADVSLYVPGYCDGRLDPNKAPDARFVPTEVIPFGKYENHTISEVLASDPDYLFYLAETYHPNEERTRGRWMAFLRDTIAPQLKERAATREAEALVRESRKAASRATLAPLAAVLRAHSKHESDFCASMAKHLEAGDPLDELPPRAQSIVSDIWCRNNGGRRNSKAYAAAEEEFQRRFVPPQPLPVKVATELIDRIEGLCIDRRPVCPSV